MGWETTILISRCGAGDRSDPLTVIKAGAVLSGGDAWILAFLAGGDEV